MREKTLSFFDKINLVIAHPHRFFDKIKEERNIWDVFKFCFIFVFLSSVINTLFMLPKITESSISLAISKYMIFVSLIVISVLLASFFVTVSSFIFYYVYHIIIRLFGGKNNFKKTYKLLYAATPLLLVCLIPYFDFFKLIFYPLFVIALIDSIYLEFVGLQKLQRLSKENAFVVVAIALIISILPILFFVRL